VLSPVLCSRRRALWLDFSAVVDSAEADGSLDEAAAADLRRLAYSGAACLADIYAAGAAPGRENDRVAFLARARRALEAAAAAATASQEASLRGAAERAAVQAAAQAAAMSPPQPPAPAPAAAAIAAA